MFFPSRKRYFYAVSPIYSKKIGNLVFCQRYRGDSWNKELSTSLGSVNYLIENLKDLFAAESSIVFTSSVGGQLVLDEQPLAYHATRAALQNHRFSPKTETKSIEKRIEH